MKQLRDIRKVNNFQKTGSFPKPKLSAIMLESAHTSNGVIGGECMTCKQTVTLIIHKNGIHLAIFIGRNIYRGRIARMYGILEQ